MKIKHESEKGNNAGGYIAERVLYIGVKEISVRTVIENSIAVTYMTQTYAYPK